MTAAASLCRRYFALLLGLFALSGAKLGYGQTERSPTVKLDGYWQFYWKQLLEPHHVLPAADLSVKLGIWNGLQLPSGEVISSFGYATYAHDTPSLVKGREYTLSMAALGSSGKIFVFHPDHPESYVFQEVGKVSAEQSSSTKRALVVSFRAQHDGAYKILVQVANHRNHKGGIWGRVEFGEASTIRSITKINDLANMLVVGIALAVGIHSLLTWLRDRRYWIPLLLAVIGIGGIIRVLGTSPYFADIFPESFEFILRKLEYLSIPWSVIYLFFLRASFGVRSWEKRATAVLVVFCVPLLLLPLFTPVFIFSQFLVLYQISIVLVAMLSVVMTLRAAFEKQRGAYLILISIFFFCVFIGNDVFLVSIFHQHGIFTFPWGIAICLILNLVLMTQRAAEAQAMAHYLSSERESIQRELRLEVESRFHLASQVAHKLNNPLNYISTASFYIQDQVLRLQEEVLGLFHGADQTDPELREVETHFKERLQHILEPFHELREGVDLAAASILEIRSLSGIDGTNLRVMDLGESLHKIVMTVYEHSPKIRDLLSSTLQDLHQPIYVEFHSLKNSLELALRLDLHFPDHATNWQITVVEEPDSPVLGIVFAWQPRHPIAEKDCRDRENQANHLLKRFHAKMKIHTQHHKFAIELLVPRTIASAVTKMPLSRVD